VLPLVAAQIQSLLLRKHQQNKTFLSLCNKKGHQLFTAGNLALLKLSPRILLIAVA